MTRHRGLNGLLAGWRGREQAPRPGHALEVGFAAILETNARARDEVLDGARHEHVAGRRGGGDSSADVDGDAADLALDRLHLADVEPRAHGEAQGSRTVTDGERAADGVDRNFEYGKEAVAGGIDFAPAEASKALPHKGVVPAKEVLPRRVADLRRSFGGAGDVDEEHGRYVPAGPSPLTADRHSPTSLPAISDRRAPPD